jgi:hypothetical protein
METMDFSSNINYSPMVDGSTQPKPEGKIPEGLIISENKVEESQQMADFSTPIEELVHPGPGQMVQDAVMGSATTVLPSQEKSPRSNPLNLTDEQYTALIAGASASLAFSRFVQDKLVDMIPTMVKDNYLTTTGLLIMALVTALIFYFLKKSVV